MSAEYFAPQATVSKTQ